MPPAASSDFQSATCPKKRRILQLGFPRDSNPRAPPQTFFSALTLGQRFRKNTESSLDPPHTPSCSSSWTLRACKKVHFLHNTEGNTSTQQFSERGPWTGSISSPWELVKNANHQGLPKAPESGSPGGARPSGSSQTLLLVVLP